MSYPRPYWIGTGRDRLDALNPNGSYSSELQKLTPTKSFGPIAVADRVTVTDTYTAPVWLAEEALLPRGTYGSGFRSGWVCTGCSTAPQGAGLCQLTINWELGGPNANPDWKPLETFTLEIQELNPKIERHPHFAGLEPEMLELVKQAVHGQSSEKRSYALDMIAYDVGNPDAELAAELIDLLKKGVETYYLAGLKYTRTHYSFTIPTLQLGGVISNPEGNISPYLDTTALSWLRLADVLSPAGVNGSTYKIDSTWLGAPNGHWSETIYAAQ